MTLKVTVDRTANLKKAMATLLKQEVLVGVPAENADRASEDAGPVTNALIGYVMETGEPAKNIPARPHLVAGVEASLDQVKGHMKEAALAAISGKAGDVKAGLEKAGFVAENGVKAKITEGPFAPLSPKTLSARRSRGNQSEKPLIDTGQYRRSITHVIRSRSR